VTGRILSLGECMVELAPVGDGLYRRSFAGDTYNFAWYLRRLLPPEWRVGYGTWLGTDALSDEMAAAMAAAGIETAAIRRTEARTVGLYMIELSGGERSFTYWRSRSAARLLASDPAWLEPQLEGASLVLFSGITLAVVEPEHRATLLAALARARERGTLIALDPNLRPRLWQDARSMCAAMMEAADIADIALPSFEDEQRHFGDATPEATCERYRGRGAGTVVVKNGAGEIVAWDASDGAVRLKPPSVEAVDTTAAGDSFNAGFIAARLRGAPLADAVGAGARLASEVVRHPGALVSATARTASPD
jgi:2-dehydro-3-deoxygluconokinase